jgi:diguanylate cyclase (GGDEF)-like protein/PAS domain S-box-containing protein
MPELDMRTLIYTHVVINLVCVLVIMLLWLQSRRRFAGTHLWALGFACQTVGFLLIVLRGAIPDWISLVVANSLFILGAILCYRGLERFVGRVGPQTHHVLLLAAFVVVHAYFSLVRPSLPDRNLLLSVVLLMVCGQCVWLLFSPIPPAMRRLTRGVGGVFVGFCLVSLLRIGDYFRDGHVSTDYLHAGAFEMAVLFLYQVLFILLMYSLALMVNKRLLAEIATQEEKFAKAFRSSPYAITFTRMADGMIIEINEGFTELSGYSPAEAVGKTTLDLHLWAREEDRLAIVKELSGRGRIRGREIRFRKKTGEMITGLFSADLIEIDSEPCIQSSIADISELKRKEEEIEDLAVRDPLTGLYNRRGFISLAEQQLKVADRTRKGLCLFYMDLDDMKRINDRFGHRAGDEALKEATAVLTGVFRESDVLARVGGDEFAVLALDASPEFSFLFADRLKDRLDAWNETAERPYRLSMSVGMAYADPAVGLSLDELMARADEHMYDQKRSRS